MDDHTQSLEAWRTEYARRRREAFAAWDRRCCSVEELRRAQQHVAELEAAVAADDAAAFELQRLVAEMRADGARRGLGP